MSRLYSLDELLAALFLVEVGKREHAADNNQFLVVDLQDVASAHGGFDDFLGEETLAQIDVENLHAVGGGGIRNFAMVSRLTTLRWASEPKQTAWQLRATCSISGAG